MLIEYVDRTKLPPPDATWLDVILYSREQVRCGPPGEDLALPT